MEEIEEVEVDGVLKPWLRGVLALSGLGVDGAAAAAAA